MTCATCGSTAPMPGCPVCELRQPSLFPLPEPPRPDPDRLARDLAEDHARFRELARSRGRDAAFASLGRPARVALVAGSNRPSMVVPAPARRCFLGDVFRASLQVAERIADEACILSPTAGLLELDAVVTSVQTAFQTLSRKRRESWAERLRYQLLDRYPHQAVIFILLAGDDWRRAIAPALWRSRWSLDDSFTTLLPGKRRGWLSAQLRQTKRAWRGVLS